MGSFPETEQRYSVVEVLTSGPLAGVARAVEATTGAAVVVKRFAPTAPDAAQRFLQAVGALGLRLPGVPMLLDCGLSPAAEPWLAFEQIPGAGAGRSLDTLVGAPPAQLLPLLLLAADALEALAGRGLAHHNLSLDNLVALPGALGEPERLALFGLGTGLLYGGPAAGAAPFAAPELSSPDGTARADWRADLYSLALLTCRLLEARVDGAGTPAPAVGLPLAMSFELEDAEILQQELERCLWRDPRERPGSFADLQRALRRALPQGQTAAPRAHLTFVTSDRPDEEVEAEEEGTGAEAPAAPGEEDPGDSTNPVLSLEEIQPPTPPVEPPVSLELTINQPPPVPPAPAAAAPVKLDTAVFIPPPPPPAPLPRSAGTAAAAASPQEAPGQQAPGTAWPEEPKPVPRSDSAAILPFPAGIRTGAPAPMAPPAAPPPVHLAASREPYPPDHGPEHPDAAPEALSPIPPAAEALPPQGPFAADDASVVTRVPESMRRPPSAAAARRPSGARLPLAIALTAAALLAVAAGLLWLERGPAAGPAAGPGDTAPAAGQVPATGAGAAPAVQAVLHPALAGAAAAFASGDEAGARTALAALGGGAPEALSAADCQALLSLGQAIDLARVERLARDLGRGLRTGDVALLAAAARAAAGLDHATLAAEPDLARGLAEARRAADLYQTLQEAERAGDPAQVLAAAGSLAAAFPLWAGADEPRERAAAALESEAETLLASGDSGAALARLEALERAWPDRPGLAERMAGIGAQRRSEQGIEQLLATAAAAEARRRPDEGLAALRGARATPRLEGRLREARARLERMLAELDHAAPQIALPADLPEIEKGAPARVRLRVSDDYQVAEVTARARPEGGAWTDLPAERAGEDWTVEIPAALHGNRPVELTVAATDLSGHRAEAGPSQLKRKRWFQKLRPRRGGEPAETADPGDG